MLKIKNLKKTYTIGHSNNSQTILNNVSFTANKGEFIAIMGESGSGKTTLLNCISEYISADSGSITLNNEEITNFSETQLAEYRNKNLGFVFQDFMLLDGLTIKDNILLPKIIDGKIDKSATDSMIELCKFFEISDIENKYPFEVSGGQKQRTAVARAFINKPDLVLADEPTGNLDSKATKNVIELFKKAKSLYNTTILMVTHDPFLASYCDKVVILSDGEVLSEFSKNEDNINVFREKILNTLGDMWGDVIC